jgi:hypothetical protein
VNPTFEYALHSALWAAAGLVVGFSVGRVTRTVDRLADDVEVIADVVTEGEAPVPVRRRKRPRSEQVVGAVLVLLGLFTAASSLYQDSATRRVADCVRAYSDGFADAFESRANANTEWQLALDGLMTEVGRLANEIPTPENRERFRTALREYLDTRAESRQKQADHPLPEPPRDVCG